MNQLICTGIASKKYLIFSYDEGKRTVEPYCYSITKKGNEVLRAYQIGGYSKFFEEKDKITSNDINYSSYI